MKMRVNRISGIVGALGILVLLFLSGCAKSESAAIATSEIVATYELKGGPSVECNATFNVGGSFGTYVELTGGDEVWCSDGERSVKLRKDESMFNVVTYTGGSELRNEAGRIYTFSFRRGSSNTYDSTVVLPEPLALTAPTSGAQYKKGGNLYTVWNAGTGSTIDLLLTWRYQSETHTLRSQSSDNGSYVFSGFDTKLQGASGVIPTTLTVTRISRGTHTTGLKGGSVSAKQSQTVSFTFVD